MLSKALTGIEDSIRVHKLLQKNLLQSIEKGFNFELSIYDLQVIAPYYTTKPDWACCWLNPCIVGSRKLVILAFMAALRADLHVGLPQSPASLRSHLD